MLLKEALLQGELIATQVQSPVFVSSFPRCSRHVLCFQAIELPRACASRREARYATLSNYARGVLCPVLTLDNWRSQAETSIHLRHLIRGRGNWRDAMQLVAHSISGRSCTDPTPTTQPRAMPYPAPLDICAVRC